MNGQQTTKVTRKVDYTITLYHFHFRILLCQTMANIFFDFIRVMQVG